MFASVPLSGRDFLLDRTRLIETDRLHSRDYFTASIFERCLAIRSVCTRLIRWHTTMLPLRSCYSPFRQTSLGQELIVSIITITPSVFPCLSCSSRAVHFQLDWKQCILQSLTAVTAVADDTQEPPRILYDRKPFHRNILLLNPGHVVAIANNLPKSAFL